VILLIVDLLGRRDRTDFLADFGERIIVPGIGLFARPERDRNDAAAMQVV
jgi:hypothetical protein